MTDITDQDRELAAEYAVEVYHHPESKVWFQRTPWLSDRDFVGITLDEVRHDHPEARIIRRYVTPSEVIDGE